MQALIVEEPSSEPKESNPANLVALKTQTTALRDQIYRLEKEEEFKSGGGGRRASGKSLTSSSADGASAAATSSNQTSHCGAALSNPKVRAGHTRRSASTCPTP